MSNFDRYLAIFVYRLCAESNLIVVRENLLVVAASGFIAALSINLSIIIDVWLLKKNLLLYA